MLSQRISAVAETFERYRGSPMVLEPEAADLFAGLIRSFVEEAEALEASRISPVAMAGEDLPENVIRIARILDSRGVRTGLESSGGDVA